MRFAARRFLICSTFLALGCIALCPNVNAAERTISYRRDIKPIVAGGRFACRGPDEKDRKEDLRFDIENDVAKKAINATKPSESELIHRITSDDPDVQMPPVASKKPRLLPQEVAIIKKWV